MSFICTHKFVINLHHHTFFSDLTLMFRYISDLTLMCLEDGFNEIKDQLRRLKVVVVNHCFTSLFGTKGLLSDIVIR